MYINKQLRRVSLGIGIIDEGSQRLKPWRRVQLLPQKVVRIPVLPVRLRVLLRFALPRLRVDGLLGVDFLADPSEDRAVEAPRELVREKPGPLFWFVDLVTVSAEG